MQSILHRNKTYIPYLAFNIHPAIAFLLLILFLKLSTAKLTVYDSSNNEISSYDNVDFMGIDRVGYGTVTGKLLVAKFANPKDISPDPCKVTNLPTNGEVAIIVIPFKEAYDAGCSSFADIITSNHWKKEKGGNKASTNVPKNPTKEPQPGDNGGKAKDPPDDGGQNDGNNPNNGKVFTIFT